MMVFTGLLFWAVLTIWVPERWAWSLFQAAVFLFAAWRVGRGREFRFPSAATALMAGAAWPLVQLAAGGTVDRGATWVAALNWASFLVVFLLATDLFRTEPAQRRFLRAAALGGAALAAVSVIQCYSSGGRIFWLFPSGFTEGVLGPFVNRNQYAAWVELLLPVALLLAATARRPALYGVAAAVLLGSVIAGASRAGAALAVVEVLVAGFALTARRATPRRTMTLWALQVATFAAIAIAVVGWQELKRRLEAPNLEVLRVDALRASLDMVRDRPWLGSGLGTWPQMYPRYAGLDTGVVVNQAHNDWMQWAAEGGLPFVAFLIIFAALLWKPAFRSIYGLGVVAFLLHALVDYPMQQRPGLAAWWFAMAGAVWAGKAAAGHEHDDFLRRIGSVQRSFARGDPPGI